MCIYACQYELAKRAMTVDEMVIELGVSVTTVHRYLKHLTRRGNMVAKVDDRYVILPPLPAIRQLFPTLDRK